MTDLHRLFVSGITQRVKTTARLTGNALQVRVRDFLVRVEVDRLSEITGTYLSLACGCEAVVKGI